MTAQKKFLLFGDSITEFAFEPNQWCLGQALQNIYARKMDIVQRGYIGYNTRWCLKILPDILDGLQDVGIAYIFLGSNDAMTEGCTSVPLPEYLSNIKSMAEIMIARDIKVVIVGQAKIDRPKWDHLHPEDLANGWIRGEDTFYEYALALRRLCQVEGLPFVDLQTKFEEVAAEKWRDLLVDGLHLSGEGYKIFYEELLNIIKIHYPEYHPTNIHYQYPEFFNIKPDLSNLLE